MVGCGLQKIGGDICLFERGKSMISLIFDGWGNRILKSTKSIVMEVALLTENG